VLETKALQGPAFHLHSKQHPVAGARAAAAPRAPPTTPHPATRSSLALLTPPTGSAAFARPPRLRTRHVERRPQHTTDPYVRVPARACKQQSTPHPAPPYPGCAAWADRVPVHTRPPAALRPRRRNTANCYKNTSNEQNERAAKIPPGMLIGMLC